MIIQSIEMYNYRQYVGNQKIIFSTDKEKNVTVLVGVNTSGKTTIIRAFEWCLYGKNDFDDPVLLNCDIRDNMHEGETQSVWVSICFLHDGKQYNLKRKYQYLCNERSGGGAEVIVHLNKRPEEELVLEYLQQDGQTKTQIERSNIEESIDRILPKDLSDYFFFGGERISGIANRTDLSKAVRGLMRLDILEHAKEHISKVTREFSSQIDTSGDASAEAAQNGLKTCSQKKNILDENLQNMAKERDFWDEKEREYAAELLKSNVEQVKRAKKTRDIIDNSIKRENDKLIINKKEIITLFNNRPYSFFGMPLIAKSLEILDLVKDSTESIPGMDQDAIDFIVNRGTCICGTLLLKDTAPYNLVMAERRKLPPEQIGAVVNNFKIKAEGYLSGSEDYCNNIIEKYREIRVGKRTIEQLIDDREKQSELIVDDVDAQLIETKRADAYTKFCEAKEDYEQTTKDIGRCDENIRNYERAIEKYAKSSQKNSKVAEYIHYSECVLDWLTETYQAKETIVRNELQERVNNNFKKMYHGERSISIDDKYHVRYSDITTEESDGLKAVKSFAFIASLVSMAKDRILDDDNIKLGQVYPIVMDAPFSNVDEIHINNICNILPETANQVILAVMKKDWEFAEKNLKKRVGLSYLIEKDKDQNGNEIETSTHIRKE